MKKIYFILTLLVIYFLQFSFTEDSMGRITLLYVKLNHFLFFFFFSEEK